MSLPASWIIGMREEMQDIQRSAKDLLGRDLFIKQAACSCDERDTSPVTRIVIIMRGKSGVSDAGRDVSNHCCAACSIRSHSSDSAHR
jgi:hypothetical protein